MALTGKKPSEFSQATVDSLKSVLGISGQNSAAYTYGISINETSPATYTRLGGSAMPVHDRIRQCVFNNAGDVVYYLDRKNGWNKDGQQPTKHFTDLVQDFQDIDKVKSLNAFVEVVAGQGISNSSGEYAVIRSKIDNDTVVIERIAPVPLYYGQPSSISANHLVDSTKTFANVKSGDIVHNRYTDQKAKVIDVNAGDLTLSADIITNQNNHYYSIYEPFFKYTAPITERKEFYIHTAILDGADGEVGVVIPKFYWKYTRNASVVSYELSETAQDGYIVFPAFVVGGVEVDYCIVGAFEAWNDADPVTPKLHSVVGKMPTANLSRADFRTRAQNHGSQYSQMTWYQLFMLQILYVTKYGNWDSQKAIGKGMSSFFNSSYGQSQIGTITNTEAIVKSGASLHLGVSGGSSFADSNDPTAVMSVFGIENFYGNLNKWIDGVNIELSPTSALHIHNSPSEFADDTAVNYADSILIPTYREGYWGSTMDTDKGLLPASCSDSDGATEPFLIPDYSYLPGNQEGSGWLVVFFGGYSDNGGSAGVGYLYTGFGSTFAYTRIGSRLCFCGKLPVA